jgi:hypothetical protein
VGCGINDVLYVDRAPTEQASISGSVSRGEHSLDFAGREHAVIRTSSRDCSTTMLVSRRALQE